MQQAGLLSVMCEPRWHLVVALAARVAGAGSPLQVATAPCQRAGKSQSSARLHQRSKLLRLLLTSMAARQGSMLSEMRTPWYDAETLKPWPPTCILYNMGLKWKYHRTDNSMTFSSSPQPGELEQEQAPALEGLQQLGPGAVAALRQWAQKHVWSRCSMTRMSSGPQTP